MAFDPYFDAVSLLLHCNGSDGSATFTDASRSAHAFTAYGDAKIKTAQSVFGGASAYFDGVGDYVASAATGIGGFGTGDFAVELWVRPDDLGGSVYGHILVDFRADSTNANNLVIAYGNPADGIIQVIINGTVIVSSAASLAVNVFSHLAVVRYGGYVSIYINGALSGSPVANSTNLSSPQCLIGSGAYRAAAADQYFKGYIDELRVTKGVARYAAAFTVPSAEFGDRLGYATSTTDIVVAGLSGSARNGHSASTSTRDIVLLGIQPKISFYTVIAQVGTGLIEVSGIAASSIFGSRVTAGIGLVAISGVPGLQGITRRIKPIYTGSVSVKYRCYLSGYVNGGATFRDVEIPISSFQVRMAFDGIAAYYTSYLSVVAPAADTYSVAIAEQGLWSDLVVKRFYHYADGSFEMFEIARVPFERVDTAEGDRSGVTGTLSGFNDLVELTPCQLALNGGIVTRQSTGSGRRYRAEFDPRPRPRDTVTINGETFMISEVIYIVDDKTCIMEIQESL